MVMAMVVGGDGDGGGDDGDNGDDDGDDGDGGCWCGSSISEPDPA